MKGMFCTRWDCVVLLYQYVKQSTGAIWLLLSMLATAAPQQVCTTHACKSSQCMSKILQALESMPVAVWTNCGRGHWLGMGGGATTAAG